MEYEDIKKYNWVMLEIWPVMYFMIIAMSFHGQKMRGICVEYANV